MIAPSQGDTQGLPNGDTLVGWGAAGRVSEFSPAGELLWDAQVPAGYDNYRAYRDVWVGKPDTDPTASASTGDDGTVTVHAIWNGATEVARWLVPRARARTMGLHPVGLDRLGTGSIH